MCYNYQLTKFLNKLRIIIKNNLSRIEANKNDTSQDDLFSKIRTLLIPN